MNHLRPLLILLAAPILLLSSCIDSREEVWLYPSGGGKARITVSLPSSAITLRGGTDAVARDIDEFLAKHPSIASTEKHITTQDNRTTIDVSLHFNSALDLSSSMAKSITDTKIPSPVRHFIGKTSILQDGLAFTGERMIDVGKAIPGSRLLPSTGNNYRLKTILHLPFAPTEHNATRTENKGRSLIWDIPLATAMRAPHIQRIRVQPPAPLIAGFGIGASLIILTLLLLWRKRRRRLRSLQAAPVDPPDDDLTIG